MTLAFFELTNTDVYLQEFLYHRTLKLWILQDPHPVYRAIFYNGIKIPLYIIGLMTITASIISFKKNKWIEYRKGFLVVSLTLILLPSLIAFVGKKVTNVQCPDDTNLFSGTIPYVKLFDSYPKNPDSPDGKWFPGHCFPAGHASGGFALISLYCLFKKRKNKILGLALGITMGSIMGGYQMLRGAHFISHNLVTMLLAFIIVSTLNILIKDFDHETSKT